MDKDKAIPQGYMTVGELAKKMGTTVRTLQYYDKKGLFSPSSESNGGRRLYTHKDMVKLHQILSLKSLGFSLDDIKNRLISLDTPADVADALSEQAAVIQKKIRSLSESLKAIEALRTEVLQMHSVDFKKYADIIVNLQMRNDSYWLIKYFDDNTLDHIRNRFDKDSGMEMLTRFTRLRDEAVIFQQNQVPPDSEKAQRLAEEFWNMVMDFTGGDMSMISKLVEIGNFNDLDTEWKQKQVIANAYFASALELYFSKMEKNPLEEG